MVKRALADVLWEAANAHLWDGRWRNDGDAEVYSCHAAVTAMHGNLEDSLPGSPIETFLESLGCNVSVSHFHEFQEGCERQGVRYVWLLLAMHVAADEGIMVEVPNA